MIIINIDNIKAGMIVKNYITMCELLFDKETTGNSKQAQLKEWKGYFDWDRIGQKYLITKIYNIPLDKVDNRVYGRNAKSYPNYCVDRKYDNYSGVYCILHNNDIYIGSTKTIRRRFLQHMRLDTVKIAHNMLLSGGTFHVLWFDDQCDKTFDIIKAEAILRGKEQELINYYVHNTKFNVVNKNTKTYVYGIKKSLNKCKLKSTKFRKFTDEELQYMNLIFSNTKEHNDLLHSFLREINNEKEVREYKRYRVMQLENKNDSKGVN